jgi:hypothetical protein
MIKHFDIYVPQIAVHSMGWIYTFRDINQPRIIDLRDKVKLALIKFYNK